MEWAKLATRRVLHFSAAQSYHRRRLADEVSAPELQFQRQAFEYLVSSQGLAEQELKGKHCSLPEASVVAVLEKIPGKTWLNHPSFS